MFAYAFVQVIEEQFLESLSVDILVSYHFLLVCSAFQFNKHTFRGCRFFSSMKHYIYTIFLMSHQIVFRDDSFHKCGKELPLSRLYLSIFYIVEKLFKFILKNRELTFVYSLFPIELVK